MNYQSMEIVRQAQICFQNWWEIWSGGDKLQGLFQVILRTQCPNIARQQ